MKPNKFAFATVLILMFVLTCGLSFANEERYYKTKKYGVTITNLTRGQVFSPPIVIAHDGKFSLFTLGEPAGDQLAYLAEDGLTDPLVELIKDSYPYAVAEVADGPVPPGGSISVELKIGKYSPARLISVAGMLVITNDAFFAARDIWFLGKRTVVAEAEAYDAGSERNSEDCNFIPGPPCNNGGVRDIDGAEGYVHIHAGIHGLNPEGEASDLNPAMHDWRNPVAKITIQRVYH